MALGSGIFLIVIGAILSFAVGDKTDVIDLPVVGYICMVAGVIAIVLSLVLNKQATSTTHREVVEKRDESNPPA